MCRDRQKELEKMTIERNIRRQNDDEPHPSISLLNRQDLLDRQRAIQPLRSPSNNEVQIESQVDSQTDSLPWFYYRTWISSAFKQLEHSDESQSPTLNKKSLASILYLPMRNLGFGSNTLDAQFPFVCVNVKEVGKMIGTGTKLIMGFEVSEARVTDNCHASEESLKWLLYVKGSITEVFSKLVQPDDLLVIWGASEHRGDMNQRKPKRLMISDSGQDVVHVIHFRKRDMDCMPSKAEIDAIKQLFVDSNEINCVTGPCKIMETVAIKFTPMHLTQWANADPGRMNMSGISPSQRPGGFLTSQASFLLSNSNNGELERQPSDIRLPVFSGEIESDSLSENAESHHSHQDCGSESSERFTSTSGFDTPNCSIPANMEDQELSGDEVINETLNDENDASVILNETLAGNLVIADATIQTPSQKSDESGDSDESNQLNRTMRMRSRKAFGSSSKTRPEVISSGDIDVIPESIEANSNNVEISCEDRGEDDFQNEDEHVNEVHQTNKTPQIDSEETNGQRYLDSEELNLESQEDQGFSQQEVSTGNGGIQKSLANVVESSEASAIDGNSDLQESALRDLDHIGRGYLESQVLNISSQNTSTHQQTSPKSQSQSQSDLNGNKSLSSSGLKSQCQSRSTLIKTRNPSAASSNSQPLNYIQIETASKKIRNASASSSVSQPQSNGHNQTAPKKSLKRRNPSASSSTCQLPKKSRSDSCVVERLHNQFESSSTLKSNNEPQSDPAAENLCSLPGTNSSIQRQQNLDCLESQILVLDSEQTSPSQQQQNRDVALASYLDSEELPSSPDSSEPIIPPAEVATPRNLMESERSSQQPEFPIQNSETASHLGIVSTQDINDLLEGLPEPYRRISSSDVKTEPEDEQPKFKRLCEVANIGEVFHLKCKMIDTFVYNSTDGEEDDVGYVIVEDGTAPNAKFEVPEGDIAAVTVNSQYTAIDLDNRTACFVKVLYYSKAKIGAVEESDLEDSDLILYSVSVQGTKTGGKFQLVVDGSKIEVPKTPRCITHFRDIDSDTVIVQSSRQFGGNGTANDEMEAEIEDANRNEDCHTDRDRLSEEDSSSEERNLSISKVQFPQAKVTLSPLADPSEGTANQTASSSGHKTVENTIVTKETSDDQKLREQHGIRLSFVLLEKPDWERPKGLKQEVASRSSSESSDTFL